MNSEKNLPEYKWVSFGGGINSTAMLIEMVLRKERIDLILFADTGGEKPHTYQHTLKFSDWLRSHSYPEIIWVKDGRETLEEESLRRKQLPSVAYGPFKSCSDKYKIRPQRRYVREWMKSKGVDKITRCIGFHVDEQKRVRESKELWAVNRFPLIEYGLDQEDCEDTLKENGIATPGKSSCFYCPNSKPKEVQEMKQRYPDLYERALRMEDNADLNTIKGLGRMWSWGDVDIKSPHVDLSPCECVDG